ncbi:MAG: glycosyltransferase [Deltaproteobacteria bacterium]|jgi:glycosyltransferase involved in cell wall biosynthesis|nr:glycosyltransferase [Deltaproteobacteria bacterium]
MSAEIPVIASDFPLWKEIVEGAGCGICVDPLNLEEIARAVNRLLTDNELAAAMGANSRRAVEEVYNWQNEERKLLDLYQELI